MARRLTHPRIRTSQGVARHSSSSPVVALVALLNLLLGGFLCGLLGSYLVVTFALRAQRQRYHARLRQPSAPQAYAAWLLRQHG